MSLKMKLSVLLAAVALLAADKKDPDPEPPKKTPPKADVRGKVKSFATFRVVDGGQVARLRIEGKKEKDTKYAKASVIIMTTTKLYIWKGGKKVPAKIGDIDRDATVQCIFAGAVAGPNPQRVRLKELLILPPAKAKK